MYLKYMLIVHNNSEVVVSSKSVDTCIIWSSVVKTHKFYYMHLRASTTDDHFRVRVPHASESAVFHKVSKN